MLTVKGKTVIFLIPQGGRVKNEFAEKKLINQMRRLAYVRVFSTLLFLLLYTGVWGFSHDSADEFCSTNQPKIFSATQSIVQVDFPFPSKSAGDDECRFEARSDARDLTLIPTNYTDLTSLVAIHKIANFNTAKEASPIYYFTSRHRIHAEPIYLTNESLLM